MRRTVLIVDDHPDYRSSARRMLESEGFAIVGEAGDGQAALAEAVRLQPGIVLLDIQLPDIDGFAVAERLADTPDLAGDRAHLDPSGRGIWRPGRGRAGARVPGQADPLRARSAS